MNQEPIVEISDVSFAYQAELVLKDISFDVKRGEFLGLIGPNGSGKSTLLKIILGLLTPQKGTVKLFGKKVQEFSHWHRVGYVPQRAAMQNFTFPITVSEVVGMSVRKQEKSAVAQALRDVELFDKRNALMHELSGGQQQRVFIARALATKPELLILDEPTAGVDIEAQVNFYDLLKKLNQDLHLTLILVSHDIDVIVNEVTTVVCINRTLICHLPPAKFVREDYLKEVYGKHVKFVVHGH
ncbi:metal ABC transporter ATP-binding protein [Candidatus Microgenomates bacterium]|nr:MAG: metal ABC transporter ATP-binding protein [Candidatus Microgenomates bacterium]